METLVFAVFAFIALASAIVVVAHRNPIYATMSLVVTLFSVAVLFVMLGAPFLGALQVLIYAGAIVVLFLFVIMLLNVQAEEMPQGGHGAQRWVSILAAAVFFGMLVLVFWRSTRPETPPMSEELVSMKALATELFTDYLLPFEIVGLLLLVAVIGATIAARRPPQTEGDDASGAADSEGRV
jgi:NADH-quinone oxidoreductase subunit J